MLLWKTQSTVKVGLAFGALRRYAEALGILAEKAEEFGRNQVDWSHGYQPWIGIDKEDSKKARAGWQKAWKIFIKSLLEVRTVYSLWYAKRSGRAACSLQRLDAVCLI